MDKRRKENCQVVLEMCNETKQYILLKKYPLTEKKNANLYDRKSNLINHSSRLISSLTEQIKETKLDLEFSAKQNVEEIYKQGQPLLFSLLMNSF